LLDGWNLTATAVYVETLTRKLGDCPRRPTESLERARPWFSTAAIAATVDELLTTRTPKRGRPPDISDILDVAGKHASELTRLSKALASLSGAIIALTGITDEVANVPRPSTLRPPGWQPPPMGPDEEPVPF